MGVWFLILVIALVWLVAYSRQKKQNKYQADIEALRRRQEHFEGDIRQRLADVEQRLSQLAPPIRQAEGGRDVVPASVGEERRQVSDDRVREPAREPEGLPSSEVVPIEEPEVAATPTSPPSGSVPEKVGPRALSEWTAAAWTKAPPDTEAPAPDISRPPSVPKVGRNHLSRAAEWLQKSTRQAGEKQVDWEALIGGSWLNIIGIIVLVVGMVLFSQHTLTKFGPAGKIGTGVGVSLFLLICGSLLERIKRYRLLAWTFIGGGWALLYFTAFAAHNIPASRVIESPVTGMMLLIATAAGMIAYSLSYRSALLTALAYGLGFFAITISPINNYSLLTSALLAASQLAVLRYLPWHYLALVGVAGTYLNHWRWLWPVLSQPTASLLAGEPPKEVPGLIGESGFWLSQAILAFYWVLFVATTYVRPPANQRETVTHLAVTVANTVAMLTLSAWQIWVMHGQMLHYLTAGATLAYIAAATTAWLTQRPDLYRFNSSVAVILYIVTAPLAENEFGFSEDWYALYWAIGSALTIYIGYLVRDVTLRTLAYLLSGLSCLALFAINLQAPFATPLEFSPSQIGWIDARWWIPPIVLILFFAISEWLQRTAGQAGVLPLATGLALIFSYAATGVLATYLWKISEPAYVTLSWLGAGFVLFEFGVRGLRQHTRLQGYLLLALGVGAAIAINFGQHPSIDPAAELNQPALWRITLPAVAVLSYVFWRIRIENALVPASTDENNIAAFASIVATFLTALLLWYEVNTAFVALTWIAIGLGLFELGKRLSQTVLRVNGYALCAAAFIALLTVNLYKIYAPANAGSIADWPVVSIAAAAFYSLTWNLLRVQPRALLGPLEGRCATVPSMAGTAILAILAWKELDAIYVAPAWTLMALALTEIGLLARQTRIQDQGHVLALFAFGRLFVANLVAPGEVAMPFSAGEWDLSHRLLTVVPVVGAFYYLRHQSLDSSEGSPRRFAHLYSWAAVILLLALVRFEFGRAFAVIGMAVIALGLLIAGRRFDDVHFRIQSYILGILIFARSWATNAYLIGSFYGLPERVATIVPCIVVLAIMSLLSSRIMDVGGDLKSPRLRSLAETGERTASDVLAVLAAVLMAILIYYEVPTGLITIAWGIEAFVLIALGLVIEKRSLRLSGLLLVLVSLLKLTLIDMMDAEPVYRIMSFLALGVILLAASLIYTRYRNIVEKYM